MRKITNLTEMEKCKNNSTLEFNITAKIKFKIFKNKSTNFCWNIEVWAMQKHVNLLDLVKSFLTR